MIPPRTMGELSRRWAHRRRAVPRRIVVPSRASENVQSFVQPLRREVKKRTTTPGTWFRARGPLVDLYQEDGQTCIVLDCGGVSIHEAIRLCLDEVGALAAGLLAVAPRVNGVVTVRYGKGQKGQA